MDWRENPKNPKADQKPSIKSADSVIESGPKKNVEFESSSKAGRRTSLLRTIINIASKYPPRLNISSNVTNRSAECIKSASITESVRSVNPGRYRSGSFSISGTKETSTVVRDFYEETGFKSINQYTIMHNIGHGIHGKVKLCYNNDTGEYCAMKVVYKNPRRSFTSRFLLKDSTSGFHKQFDIREAHVSNIRKEIAIMKACSHPNIVRLYEVIDDPEENKIYLFLEYVEGGEVKWKTDEEPYRPVISQDRARVIFRDILCGIEYLHYQGIVHRDIKPANLLCDSSGRIKIADFSVSAIAWPLLGSNESVHSSDILAIKKEFSKLVGSPAFFGPELCHKEYIDSLEYEDGFFQPEVHPEIKRRKSLGSLYELKVVKHKRSLNENASLKEFEPIYYQVTLNRSCSMPEIRSPAYRVEQTASLPMAMASDIWAIGITLYCLIYGRVPFYGETKHDLFKVITTSPLNFPDDVSVPDDLKYLLTKLLDKSPAKRITIRKAKMAKWTTSDMTPEEVKEWIHETDPRVAGKVIGATNEEIKNAFTKLLSKIYHKVRGIGGTMNRPAIHRAFLRRSR